jgi:tRNA(fMet)-specific endonuclease VapC
MKYLLDTNTCIQFFNGDKQIAKKIQKIGSKSISVANCVLAELYYGAYNSGRVTKNIEKLEALKKDVTLFSDSEESAKIFGQIKVELKKLGKPTQDFDLLISSIALANDCVLVTSNIRHFKNVPNLRVEDWLAS